MSDSDWNKQFLFGLAVVLALFATAAFGAFAWSEHQVSRRAYQQYQDRAYTKRHEAADNIAEKCAIASAPRSFIAECIADEVGAYQEADASEKDLQAQQDMADWAFWTAIVGAGALFVSILGLAALLVSLNQTRRAISDAREIGEAQVRAYLTPRKIKFGSDKGVPTFKITFVNTGQTPAKQVVGRWGCTPNRPTTLLVVRETEPHSQRDVGGGGTFPAYWKMTNLQGAAEEAFFAGQLPLWINAHLKYRDVFGRERHTWCQYAVHGSIGDDGMKRMTAAIDQHGNYST